MRPKFPIAACVVWVVKAKLALYRVSKSGASVDKPIKQEVVDEEEAEMLLHDPEREDSTQLLEPLPPLTLPLGATLNPLRVSRSLRPR